MTPTLKSLSKTKKAFHLCAVQLVFTRDDAAEVRHMNLVIETDGSVTRDHLNQIHKSAVERLCDETGITPAAVKDVVILNISPLGMMTKEFFLGIVPVANERPA